MPIKNTHFKNWTKKILKKEQKYSHTDVSSYVRHYLIQYWEDISRVSWFGVLLLLQRIIAQHALRIQRQVLFQNWALSLKNLTKAVFGWSLSLMRIYYLTIKLRLSLRKARSWPPFSIPLAKQLVINDKCIFLSLASPTSNCWEPPNMRQQFFNSK